MTRPGWVTGPGCSRGTCGCGSAASIWTAIPMTWPTCWTRRDVFAAFRRPGRSSWPPGMTAARPGERPPGRVLPHQTYRPTTAQRYWSRPLYHLVVRPGRPAPARPVPRPRLTASVRGQPPAPVGRLVSYRLRIRDRVDPGPEGWWDMRWCRSPRRGRVSLAATAAVLCVCQVPGRTGRTDGGPWARWPARAMRPGRAAAAACSALAPARRPWPRWSPRRRRE